jgi:hypothetical protein
MKTEFKIPNKEGGYDSEYLDILYPIVKLSATIHIPYTKLSGYEEKFRIKEYEDTIEYNHSSEKNEVKRVIILERKVHTDF